MKQLIQIPKALAVLFSVVALGGATWTPFVQTAAAQTPTLDVTSFGAIGNGHVDDTTAIQQALDAGAGKQVYVPAGVYKVRPLWVRTATMLNLNPGATLLLAAGCNANVITVTAPGATVSGGGAIDGNRAQQTTGAGLSVGGASDVTISDVQIVNAAGYGIYAANATNLTISGVSVSGTDNAGIFAEATTGKLTHAAIINNHVDRSSEGGSIVEGGIVVHRTGAKATVSEIRISGNTVVMPKGPRDQAVAIETYGGVEGAVIQDNTTKGGYIGISLAQTTAGSVSGNTVSGASMYGIELAASQASAVSTNTITCAGYTQQGIVLDNFGPTDDDVSNNVISGCTTRGIALSPGSDRTSISHNQISQSAGYGIEILSSGGVRVTGNSVDGHGSGLKAVTAESSPDLNVAANHVSDFTLRGVLIVHSDRATISDNAIDEDEGSAIHILTSRGVSVTGNTLDGRGSALDGLVVDTSSNVAASNDSFANFMRYGILLCSSSPMVLDLITITGNAFEKTPTAVGYQLSRGASLGKAVFSGNISSYP